MPVCIVDLVTDIYTIQSKTTVYFIQTHIHVGTHTQDHYFTTSKNIFSEHAMQAVKAIVYISRNSVVLLM